MSDPEYTELPTEALLAIQAGRKVEAIKLIRDETGMSLIDAKHLVDRMAADYRDERARMPAAGSEDSGVLRLIAALVVLGAVAAAFLFLL